MVELVWTLALGLHLGFLFWVKLGFKPTDSPSMCVSRFGLC